MRIKGDCLSSELRGTFPVVDWEVAQAGFQQFFQQQQSLWENLRLHVAVRAIQEYTSMLPILHCYWYLARAAFDWTLRSLGRNPPISGMSFHSWNAPDLSSMFPSSKSANFRQSDDIDLLLLERRYCNTRYFKGSLKTNKDKSAVEGGRLQHRRIDKLQELGTLKPTASAS